MNHTLSLEPGVLCGALCRLLLQSCRERPNHQKRHEECWLGKRDLASVLMQQKVLLQNSKWIRTWICVLYCCTVLKQHQPLKIYKWYESGSMEDSLQQSHIHFPCLPLGMHLGEAGDPALLYYFNSTPEWHVMTSCHPKIVQACTSQNANFDLICAWKGAQTAVRSSWGWSRAHVRDDSHWPEAAHWTMVKCRHNGFVWFCALSGGTLQVTSGYYGSWEAVTAILLVSLPYLTGASSVSKSLGLQSCPAVLHGTLAKYAAWCVQLWQVTWWFGIGHTRHGSHSQPLMLPTLSSWPSGRFARPTSGPESLAECELVILIALQVQRSSVILARISLPSGTCQDSW